MIWSPKTCSLLLIILTFKTSETFVLNSTGWPTQSYTPFYSIPLDANDEIHFFWKVNYETEEVEIEIRTIFHPELWLAVGFSDYGEPTDADFCIYWVDENGRSHFEDAWTDEASYISTDEKNDCISLNKRVVDGSKGRELHILYSREFDTCDSKDYIIEDGTTHIVYGIGIGKRRTADGLKIISGKSGFTRVQLLKTISEPTPLADDTQNIKFLNDKVKVPNVETTYWCSLHKLPPLLKKHHLTQFGPHVQKGNEALVHHMELFHCEVDRDVELPYWNGPCTSPDKPKELESCKRVISAWATGAEDLRYPDEAGEPIGGPNYNRNVMLEVHYNNQQLRDDYVDSSGISFYYTPTLRKYDAGTMELGLEYTDKMAIPPNQESFILNSYCTSDCTRVGIEKDGINVFASQLHTHLTGVKIQTKHIRGGIELPELNRDNHYSSHFQEIRKLKKIVKILPGDALITSCTYKTLGRKNVTLGGFSITDEMCVNYIHYYPKGNLEVCKSSVDTQALKDYFQYMKSYASQKISSDKGINDNYHSIQWSQMNSDMLDKFYKMSPLSMQCNQSSGERFPGNWEGEPLTKIRIPLPSKERKCSSENNMK